MPTRCFDDNGNVVTSHSTNPVPLVHIAENPSALADGGCLCDIAPTLLTLMGLDLPAEMHRKKSCSQIITPHVLSAVIITSFRFLLRFFQKWVAADALPERPFSTNTVIVYLGSDAGKNPVNHP